MDKFDEDWDEYYYDVSSPYEEPAETSKTLFGKLTAFIPKLQNFEDRGEYNSNLNKFESTFFDFIDEYPAMEGVSYSDTMKTVEPDNIPNLNAIQILVLIHYVMSTDRLVEGLWLRFVKDGDLVKCLKRLEELDQEI